MAHSKGEELFALLRAAEAKAWSRDVTGLVGDTDQQLAVIGPRSDATADDLRGLGQALERWKAEFRQARHIWGLTDLLEGRCPRTPPIYLTVPFPLEGFEECYEPVALVYVAQGTNLEAAARSLSKRLRSFRSAGPLSASSSGRTNTQPSARGSSGRRRRVDARARRPGPIVYLFTGQRIPLT
jgi:hypothetical protein